MRHSISRLPVLAVAAAMLMFHPASFAAAASDTPAQRINHPAPNFSRTALDRSRISLSAFRGKVVLLNFWASWCGPCLTEIPRFVEWQRQYGPKRLQVVGVSMDDEEKPARAIYRKYAVNYPVVMGDERLGTLYGGVMGLPVTFLIDRHGVIRHVHPGAANLSALEAEIQALLGSR